MKLKKKFKFSDGNQVWRIKITASDKLLVETRDTEKMKAYFHSYGLIDGKKFFSDYLMPEPFWLGIEAIEDDIIFFHRYAKPDMPGHRGIFAFDINTQEILWENDLYSYLFIKNNSLYVFQERFEGRVFSILDLRTGKVIEELGNNFDKINELRDEAESSVDYSNYLFPERYYSTNNTLIDTIISNKTKDVKINGSIDFVVNDNLLVFNFHQVGKGKELINKLYVFDLEKAKEIFGDILNKSANAYAPDSFFVYKNLIILLKEKKEILILEIKE